MRTSIYGVPISEKMRRKAARAHARFIRKYGASEPKDFPLSARDNTVLGGVIGLRDLYSAADGEPVDWEKAVCFGTIRMGYGHYRIGMALASAANALGYRPHWCDLLGFDSAGARMIRDLDSWYSLGSRISQKSKLFNALLWDPLMGKWYKRLLKNYPVVEASAIFADVHKHIPPETPFLATHPFNAHGALHAGLNRVVNVVPDNCPLGFHVAPDALHTVQSPSAYYIFRTLRGLGAEDNAEQGMSATEVFMTGHYVDHELVVNIDGDCDARLERLDAGAPRRVLISIGGAGAQQDLLTSVIEHLIPRIREEKVALFLNCGDHRNVLERLKEKVDGFRALSREHLSWDDSQEFIGNAASNPVSGLHVFLHENPYIAVYTTNMLMRVSDLMLTKPSELAFYPIPKLLIERVGGHEAWGALRSAELGDGTPECSGLTCTLQALDRMTLEEDLVRFYCEQIKKLRLMGVYDGAYRAVSLAVTGSPDIMHPLRDAPR